MTVSDLSYVTVTGTFKHLDGTPSTGQVEFRTSTRIVDTATAQIVMPGVVVVPLRDGEITVALPATDDTDFAPTGFTYQVKEIVDRRTRIYNISLPASPATVDLATIAPVDPVNPASTYVSSAPLETDIATLTSDVATLTTGVATLDALVPSPGMYVPKGWGATWRAALAASGSRLVNVMMLGHSVGHGWYSSDMAHAAFTGTGLVATALKSAHGDGGDGFVHISYFPGEIGVGARSSYTVTAGAWSTFNEGVNGYEKSGSGGAGSAVSITGHGRYVDIYMVKTASSGHFTYAVDGGTAVDVDTAGTSTHAIQKTTVDMGTTGAHTVVITQVTSALVNFNGVAWRNDTGVCWHNMSLPSRQLEEYLYTIGSAAGSVAQQSIGDFATPIDLLVVMCAINNTKVPRGNRFVADAVTTSASQTVTSATIGFLASDVGAAIISPNLPPGTIIQARGSSTSVTVSQKATASGSSQPLTVTRSADTFASALRKIIRVARATTPACDVVLLVEHPGKFEVTFGADNTFPGLSGAIHTVAQETGAAVINYAQLGYDSWDWMDALGYWGALGSQGPAGHDEIHLSDAGFAWEATPLNALLAAGFTP